MRPAIQGAFFALALAAALVPGATAHGYVSSITIDGEKHKGPNVSDEQTAGKFAIRAVNTINPVKGAKNPDILCGPGAKAASEHAAARPGSAIEVQWVGGGGQKWPHEVGPLLSYLAKCPDGDCSKWDAKDAQWFKIAEDGMREDGTWVHKDLMKGLPAKLSLPDGLASGAYLLRHEIIALHNAKDEGGAEFYESCAQIKVGDGGDGDEDGDKGGMSAKSKSGASGKSKGGDSSNSEAGAPAKSELVSFPGAYSDEDKGILVDAYDLKPKDYVFPGPPIAKLAAGSGNATESGSGLVNATESGSEPTPTTSAEGGDSTGSMGGGDGDGDEATTSPEGSEPTSPEGGEPTTSSEGSGPTPSEDGGNPTTSYGGSEPTASGSACPTGGARPSFEHSSHHAGGHHSSVYASFQSGGPCATDGTADGGAPATSDGGVPYTSTVSGSGSEGSPTTEGGSSPTADGSSPTTDGGSSPTTDGSSPTTDGASSPTGAPTTECSSDDSTPTSHHSGGAHTSHHHGTSGVHTSYQGGSPTTDGGASPTTTDGGASPTTDGTSPTGDPTTGFNSSDQSDPATSDESDPATSDGSDPATSDGSNPAPTPAASKNRGHARMVRQRGH
ncbi:glycoside hydrolase family 61 protein [Schizophyllum fasciatum]